MGKENYIVRQMVGADNTDTGTHTHTQHWCTQLVARWFAGILLRLPVLQSLVLLIEKFSGLRLNLLLKLVAQRVHTDSILLIFLLLLTKRRQLWTTLERLGSQFSILTVVNVNRGQ